MQDISIRLDAVSALPAVEIAEPPVSAARAFARSAVGGGARPRNEDQHVVAELGHWASTPRSRASEPEREARRAGGLLLMVADGANGRFPDVASALALDARVEHALLEMPWLGCGTREGDAALAADFQRFVRERHARLVSGGGQSAWPPRRTTTLTAAYLSNGRILVAHVGDTRAYLFRGGVLRRLTVDPTAAARRERDEDDSGVPIADLGQVGVGADVPPRPELSVLPLQPGDRLLLSSDGLHGVVHDGSIAETLGASVSPRAAADALVERALVAGGTDDVTAVVAFA